MEALDITSETIASAELDAVLDSCARSMPSVRSGMLCYMAFVGPLVPRLLLACLLPLPPSDKAFPSAKAYFPPEVRWLQVWSTMFRQGGRRTLHRSCLHQFLRHAGTFSNYCGYVKTGCLLTGSQTTAHCMPI